MFQPQRAETEIRSSDEKFPTEVPILIPRSSVPRAQVVVTRRIFGERVVDESVSIFFMKLVSLIDGVPVRTLEFFPVFRFDAFTQRIET
jgi:hypothetical protein